MVAARIIVLSSPSDSSSESLCSSAELSLERLVGCAAQLKVSGGVGLKWVSLELREIQGLPGDFLIAHFGIPSGCFRVEKFPGFIFSLGFNRLVALFLLSSYHLSRRKRSLFSRSLLHEGFRTMNPSSSESVSSSDMNAAVTCFHKLRSLEFLTNLLLRSKSWNKNSESCMKQFVYENQKTNTSV